MLYNQVVGQTKINGAAYPGIWVEKQVVFVKITFSADISAIPAAFLWELGTTTSVSAGAVGSSVFGVVESVLVQALETLELDATVLGMSQYDAGTCSVDVMLGFATAWEAQPVVAGPPPTGTTLGVISINNTFGTAQAILTSAGSAPADAVGAMVSVNPAYATFQLEYVYMDGSMPAATSSAVGTGFANGLGAYTVPVMEYWADGNGPGSQSAPMGQPGWYPSELKTA